MKQISKRGGSEINHTQGLGLLSEHSCCFWIDIEIDRNFNREQIGQEIKRKAGGGAREYL